jgi:hypothetical protein
MSELKHPLVVCNKDWQDLIGIQFALNGQDRNLGLNCYGLVREVYKMLSIDLPERGETIITNETVETESRDWVQLEQPEPYCVVLLRSHALPGQDKTKQHYHVGVVTPEMTLLHVLYKKGVVVSKLDKYTPYIVGYYKYEKDGGACIPHANGAIGRIIGSILIAIVASWAGGAIGGTIGGMIGGPFGAIVGYVVGAIVTIGIMMAGTLVVNAIFPISGGNQQIQQQGSNGDTTQYSWSGITNNFRQGANRGLLIGTIRTGGQIISEKTWFDGDNYEYLDLLVSPCVGPITRFQSIKINDTDISLYNDCTAILRPGDDEQKSISMFEKIYIQYAAGAKLSTSYVEFASKAVIEGYRIVIAAPNGLYYVNTSNAIAVPSSESCTIQYSTDAITWSNIPIGEVTYAAGYNQFLDRTAGVFTGTANPFLLTDSTGANFNEQLTAGYTFILTVASVDYYCTTTSVYRVSTTETKLYFNAFTDAGRTVPKTGAFTNGAYVITNTGIIKNISGTDDFRIVSGFSTTAVCKAIKFTVKAISVVFSWMQLKIWYRPVGGDWVFFDVFDAGTFSDATTTSMPPIGVSRKTFAIEDLVESEYQVIVDWCNDSEESTTRSINNIAITVVRPSNITTPGVITLAGDPVNPLHLVSRTIEINNLTPGNYYFRVKRNVEDSSDTSVVNSIYLRSYAEIINKDLAYPNNALIGIRAMATDRLYGGRPTITEVGVGAPLSVPSEVETKTIVSDDGIITTPNTLVNGVDVVGMKKLTLSSALATTQVSGKYYWLVRSDSSGYAQFNKMLTKWYCRVHAWSGAEVYIEKTETFVADTPLILFHEDDAPTDNLAWAITKILIYGSHGRITDSHIDWDSFAIFNTWCVAKNFKCNALIDFTTDLWSMACRLALSGRAWLVAAGGRYKIVIDKTTTPCQLFGEGNSNNVKVEFIPRADRANILVTDFLNEDKNYEQDTVSEEDVVSGEYPIVSTITTQFGITNEDHIRALLTFFLRQNRYIDKQITFDAGIDSIETEIGDVFYFASQAHDFCISGRLRNMVNGLVTLDESFTPEVGQLYKLTVWPVDMNPMYFQGYLTGTDITTIQTTWTFIVDEYYQIPYILVKVTEEKTPYRCIGISRKSETLEATIKGIEYRTELYTDD